MTKNNLHVDQRQLRPPEPVAAVLLVLGTRARHALEGVRPRERHPAGERAGLRVVREREVEVERVRHELPQLGGETVDEARDVDAAAREDDVRVQQAGVQRGRPQRVDGLRDELREAGLVDADVRGTSR